MGKAKPKPKPKAPTKGKKLRVQARGGRPRKESMTTEAMDRARDVMKLRRSKGGYRNYYDDTERAAILAALDANRGNLTDTANKLGIPISTLKSWQSGVRCPEVHDLRTQARNDLAKVVEDIAWLFATAIPSKVDDAPLNHLTTGLGIMVDKMRLLREQPTSIANNTNLNANLDLTKLTDEQLSALARIYSTCGVPFPQLDPVGAVAAGKGEPAQVRPVVLAPTQPGP